MVLAFLAQQSLRPVCAQLPVACRHRRVATAIDIVAIDAEDRIVVIELKCGHSRATRNVAARGAARGAATLKAPFKKALDTHLHRHFAQLALSLAMLRTSLADASKSDLTDICGVRGVLLYADDVACDLYSLPQWWAKRAERWVA